MARYLVVAHKTAESPALTDAVTRIADSERGTEFTLLVPATPRSYWRPWDETEAHDEAVAVAGEAAKRLRTAGALVTRAVSGSREPLAAIQDELREGGPYDGVVIATLPASHSRWLRFDLVTRARKQTGLPVTHVVAAPIRHEPSPMPAGIADRDLPAHEHMPVSAPGPGRAREDQVAALPMSLAVPSEMPEEERRLWEQVWDGDATEVFRALRSRPAVLNAYIAMLQATWDLPAIDPALRELVVLRTVQLRGSEETWREHTEIAESLGVSPERIAHVDRWQTNYQGQFDARDRAVLGYVEALCGKPGKVADARALLRDYVSEEAVLSVTLLTGFYWLSAELAGLADSPPVAAS